MNPLLLFSLLFVYGASTHASIDLSNQPRALEEGEYQDVDLPNGMPLGGIGCGSVELKTDGWFDHLTINNNWKGTLSQPESSFFAVWIRDGDRVVSKALRRADSVLDDVDRITYRGVFPCAALTFSDEDLPIDIHLDAWTPLVPWNLKDSTLPGGLFVLRCKNTTDRPLEIAFAFAWENLLGVGEDLQTGIPWEDRTGNYQEPRRSRRASGLIFATTRALEPSDSRRSALGTYALAVERQESHTVTLLPSWNARSRKTFMTVFSDDGLLFDEKEPGPWPTGSEKIHPAGAVADHFLLPAGESAEVPFALAWHCPVIVGSDGTERHSLSAITFDDAWDVAFYLLKNRRRLWSEMDRWRGALLSSSLPSWLKIRLLNDLIPLFSRSIVVDDRFALIEDPFQGTLQSTWASLLTDPFLVTFFPDLAASGLRLIVDSQREDGEIPSTLGSIWEIINGAPPGADGKQDPRAACAFALRFREYDQWRGDDDLRTKLYPALQRAMNWSTGEDTDQDGIPESLTSTRNLAIRRNSSSAAGLWLSALSAGMDFASSLGDLDHVSEWNSTAVKAKESVLTELWNGRRFKAFFDPQSPLNPQMTDVLPDQLLGEWCARYLDLEELLPSDVRQTALENLIDLFRFGPSHPQNVDQSRLISPPFDTQSLITLADLAVYEGRASDGLELIWNLHSQTVATGYGLAMPSRIGAATGSDDELAGPVTWSFLSAMEGFLYNARLQRLVLTPHLPAQWESAHLPVFGPTFQGWMDYEAATFEASRRISFRLEQTADGRPLLLSQIGTEIPPAFRNQKPILILEDPLNCKGVTQTSRNSLVFVLDKPLNLHPGDGFTLALATEKTGRIEVNVADRKVVPRGPSCTIDLLRKSPLSFTVTNRLRQPQVLNLQFKGLQKKSYQIALDGHKTGVLEGDGSVVTASLPGGAFTKRQDERVGWLPRRLNQIVQLLAKYPSETGALREVWKLRKAVEDFTVASIGGRTVIVDLAESDAELPKRKMPKTVSQREAGEIATKLETATAKFRSQITGAVSDPSLAARLLGLALPIEFDLVVQGDPGRDSKFELIATVRNPQRLPFTGRVILNAPKENWQVISEGPTTFDRGRTLLPVSTCRFRVNMPRPAIDERVEITAALVGDLDRQSFILESHLPVGHGFLRDWMLLGPCPREEGKETTKNPLTNQEVDLDGKYKGTHGEIRWTPHYSGTPYVDLSRVFEVEGPALALAHLFIYSAHDRPALLRLGVSEGVRVLVNRREMFARNDLRAARPGQFVIPVKLESGWNSLLLKVSRLRGDWGFYAEITDRSGAAIPDLKVSLRK